MSGPAHESTAPDNTRNAAESGRFYVWLPVGLAMQKVRRHLRLAGREFETMSTGGVAVDCGNGFPRDLLIELTDVLTRDEGADTRCVFKQGGDPMDVGDFARVRTLHELRREMGA